MESWATAGDMGPGPRTSAVFFSAADLMAVRMTGRQKQPHSSAAPLPTAALREAVAVDGCKQLAFLGVLPVVVPVLGTDEIAACKRPAPVAVPSAAAALLDAGVSGGWDGRQRATVAVPSLVAAVLGTAGTAASKRPASGALPLEAVTRLDAGVSWGANGGPLGIERLVLWPAARALGFGPPRSRIPKLSAAEPEAELEKPHTWNSISGALREGRSATLELVWQPLRVSDSWG